jgi:opacity protein-like surface antigen
MSSIRFSIVLFSAITLTVAAQDQQQPVAKTPGSNELRRFSIGGLLSFNIFSYMQATTRENTISDTTTFKSTSENLSSRATIGPILQMTFASRWAVAAGISYRKGGYRLTNDTTVSSKVSTVKERTDFRSWEVPILVRRFSKAHDDEGFRWFYQAGVAARFINRISSETSTTAQDGTVTCCDTKASVPRQSNILGFVAGAGITARDQFGIRVTPEIRYTRWMDRNWDSFTARSRRDQAEIAIGFQF